MVDIYQTHHFEKERGRGNNVDLVTKRFNAHALHDRNLYVRDFFSGLKRSPVVPFIRE